MWIRIFIVRNTRPSQSHHHHPSDIQIKVPRLARPARFKPWIEICNSNLFKGVKYRKKNLLFEMNCFVLMVQAARARPFVRTWQLSLSRPLFISLGQERGLRTTASKFGDLSRKLQLNSDCSLNPYQAWICLSWVVCLVGNWTNLLSSKAQRASDGSLWHDFSCWLLHAIQKIFTRAGSNLFSSESRGLLTIKMVNEICKPSA